MTKKRSTFRARRPMKTVNLAYKAQHGGKRYPDHSADPSPDMLRKLARRSAAWTGARA